MGTRRNPSKVNKVFRKTDKAISETEKVSSNKHSIIGNKISVATLIATIVIGIFTVYEVIVGTIFNNNKNPTVLLLKIDSNYKNKPVASIGSTVGKDTTIVKDTLVANTNNPPLEKTVVTYQNNEVEDKTSLDEDSSCTCDDSPVPNVVSSIVIDSIRVMLTANRPFDNYKNAYRSPFPTNSNAPVQYPTENNYNDTTTVTKITDYFVNKEGVFEDLPPMTTHLKYRDKRMYYWSSMPLGFALKYLHFFHPVKVDMDKGRRKKDIVARISLSNGIVIFCTKKDYKEYLSYIKRNG